MVCLVLSAFTTVDLRKSDKYTVLPKVAVYKVRADSEIVAIITSFPRVNGDVDLGFCCFEGVENDR
jgi:hypothetical protein